MSTKLLSKITDANQNDIARMSHTTFKIVDAIQNEPAFIQTGSLMMAVSALIKHYGFDARELLQYCEIMQTRAVNDGNSHAKALEHYVNRELKRF